MARFVRTVFVRGFKFDRNVTDTVFAEFVADRLLESGSRSGCNDMHGGVVLIAVDTPDVNVVDVFYVFDL